MTSNYKSIDANILIEVLCRPAGKKSTACQKLIQNKSIKLSHLVLGETIYVAGKIYDLSKEKTAVFLKILLNQKNIHTSNKLVLSTALSIFRANNLDWADSYLLAQYLHHQNSGIYSYDQYLDKVHPQARLEP